MVAVVGAVAGWTLLLLGAGAVVVGLGRRAAADGLLAPLVVGAGLRLVVLLMAHVGSVSLGDHGIFYLDDQTYTHEATVLAAQWRAGHLPDPAAADVIGSYQFGYQIFLAAIFALGTSSRLLGKLANVILGGITIYLVGRLGGRLLGERAKLRAAWVAALAPTLIWWSAPLMKEALATTLLVLGALAMTAAPRARSLATLALVLGALVLVRPSAAIALALGTGVALTLASVRAGRSPLSRPVIGVAAALVATVALFVAAASHGDVAALVDQYQSTVRRMFHVYQGGSLVHVPVDALKSLVTPLPWAFDNGTRSWDRMLYPGVWLTICALPLAAAGAWRLRRSPEACGILTIAFASLLINAVSAGFVFRQRSMIEPLILILALAGARSWRVAASASAAALTLTAVFAAFQSGSLPIGAAIAAAAAALAVAARRLPPAAFDPAPGSALTAAIAATAPVPATATRRGLRAARARGGARRRPRRAGRRP